jgi:hypothetical protein
MSRPNRTLRIAVGTALFALGACQKDKGTTETPKAEETEETEHSNVGPNGEAVPEHTHGGTEPVTAPTDTPPAEPTDTPPEINPTTNTSPVTAPPKG